MWERSTRSATLLIEDTEPLEIAAVSADGRHVALRGLGAADPERTSQVLEVDTMTFTNVAVPDDVNELSSLIPWAVSVGGEVVFLQGSSTLPDGSATSTTRKERN